jgi:hypothetical protein
MGRVTFVSNDVVLIVDDSKFFAQAYSRVPLGLGYRVLIACDGKTGDRSRLSKSPARLSTAMLELVLFMDRSALRSW